MAFWREATGSELSAFRGPGDDFATLLPPSGNACLRVQRVLDGDGGCHLDLHVDTATGSLDETAAQARALGARIRHVEDGLIVAETPGGFPFCLVPLACYFNPCFLGRPELLELFRCGVVT